MAEDGVQLARQLLRLGGREAEARERGNVVDVVDRDGHYSMSRSRLACATTRVLRPIVSSSKSIFALRSRPLPASSAITPEPNLRCRTRAPTAITAASCDASASSTLDGRDTGVPGRRA